MNGHDTLVCTSCFHGVSDNHDLGSAIEYLLTMNYPSHQEDMGNCVPICLLMAPLYRTRVN